MIKYIYILLLFALCIAATANAGINPPITSIEVTARTLSALPSCLHYTVKGVCFWQMGVIYDEQKETSPVGRGFRRI